MKPRRTSHNPHTPLDFLNHQAIQPRVVTCYPIRDALVIGPPAKASHHDHTLKRCRKLSSRTINGPKPLGEIQLQTAWRASHTARRQALAQYHIVPSPPGTSNLRRQAPIAFQASCFLVPPGGTHPTARHPTRPVTTATVRDSTAWWLALHRQAPYQQCKTTGFGIFNRYQRSQFIPHTNVSHKYVTPSTILYHITIHTI